MENEKTRSLEPVVVIDEDISKVIEEPTFQKFRIDGPISDCLNLSVRTDIDVPGSPISSDAQTYSVCSSQLQSPFSPSQSTPELDSSERSRFPSHPHRELEMESPIGTSLDGKNLCSPIDVELEHLLLQRDWRDKLSRQRFAEWVNFTLMPLPDYTKS